MRRPLIAAAAVVAAAGLLVVPVVTGSNDPSPVSAASVHDDAAALSAIDRAIAELNTAKVALGSPSPLPSESPSPSVTSTAPPTFSPSPTVTATVTPTVTPTPTPTVAAKALLGMSAPASVWAARRAEVEATGGRLQARRIFLSSFTSSLTLAQQACADGHYPVLSFKTGGPSWASVAAGGSDAEVRALATRLAALPCRVFVAVHHEPANDGPAADWAAMQVRVLPMLDGPTVDVGVIGNGWWWSSQAQGYTDAEIATYLPPSVLAVSEIVASDTYSTAGEDSATKMRNMLTWSDRVGVARLGIGEFNSAVAADITTATQALAASPKWAFGCVWNSTGGTYQPLTGDRLAAFQRALAAW